MGDFLVPERNYWKEWHVKGAVLVSLMLQILLLLLATFRKRTTNGLVHGLVFGVYKLSSMVADAAFGLIIGARLFNMYQMPYGLWAALMLLHLTGRDRLSAYSLEDNNSWVGHLFSVLWKLIFHFMFTHQGDMPLPTVAMVIFLCWRLLAQTLCLRMGADDVSGFMVGFPDPTPLVLNKDPRDDELNWDPDEPPDDLQTVLKARLLLRSSLRLIAGIRNGRGRNATNLLHCVQGFFLNVKDPRYGIRIVEVELDFIYKSFYTDGTIRKHLDGNYSLIYTALRSVESLFCIVTLVSFLSLYEGDNFSTADYNVTWVLLVVTVIVELVSLLLTICSDWTVAALGQHYLGDMVLSVSPNRRRWWSDYPTFNGAPTTVQVARAMFRRWSETIPRFNFLAYSYYNDTLQNLPDYTRLDVFTGTANQIRGFRFVSNDWYTDQLGNFVYDKLKNIRPESVSELRKDHLSFRRIVLSWHISTELRYNADDSPNCEAEQRQYSKLLSDYMAYLLFMRPRFISRLGANALLEAKAADAEIKRIAKAQPKGGTYESCCKFLCRKPTDSILDRSGIIFDAVLRANETTRYTWQVISEKWVELLLYAASECNAIDHVQEVSKGAELISLVWLLAFHLGLLKEVPQSHSSMGAKPTGATSNGTSGKKMIRNLSAPP